MAQRTDGKTMQVKEILETSRILNLSPLLGVTVLLAKKSLIGFIGPIVFLAGLFVFM